MLLINVIYIAFLLLSNSILYKYSFILFFSSKRLLGISPNICTCNVISSDNIISFSTLISSYDSNFTYSIIVFILKFK